MPLSIPVESLVLVVSWDNLPPSIISLPLKTESKISLLKDSQIFLKSIDKYKGCLFPLVSGFSPLRSFLLKCAWKHHHLFLPSQESHKMLLAISCNNIPGFHWSKGIWDTQGGQRLILHELYSETFLGVLGVCIIKTVHCQGPGLGYELIGNSKTKSTQHVGCKTINWNNSGGKITGAQIG